MAVAPRASATFVLGTGTTGGTIVIPASVATGDDLYVEVMSRGHTIGTALPTVTDDDAGGNLWANIGEAADRTLTLFWKKATAGTASKTVTVAGGVDSTTGGLSAFSGALASGDPTTNIVFESNASGNETHATFTPTAADSMICFGQGQFNLANPITLMACTDPGDLEPELWERTSSGGSDAYAIFAARIQVGGPTTTGAFTWAQTNAASRSVTFAIQPEPAAGGTGLPNRLLLGVG